VANFSFACTSLSCGFDASSTSAQPNASYGWVWGDGSANGAGKTPTHSYAQAGNYPVTLTVSDAGGTSGKTSTVSVSSPPAGNQPPVARPVANCSGMTCTFDARASTDDVGVVGYEWHPGGPSIISTQAVWTMTFTGAKTRTWTLTVRDAGGLSHTQSVTFSVPAP
jgi:PKD repeat protein